MNALVAPRAGSLAGHCADDLWTLWLWRGLAVGLAVALHLALGWALYRLGLAQPPVPAPKVLHTEVVMLMPVPPSLPSTAPPVVAPPATASTTAPRAEPSAPPPASTSAPAPEVARPIAKTADLARQRVSSTPRPKVAEPATASRTTPAAPAPAAPSLSSPPSAPLAGASAAPPVTAAPAASETSSQQYLPISKQAPSYPARALDDGIEGDCTVEYRVDTQGRVQDPHVVGSCHPMFIRPSLAAASTFVYRPRMVGGHAVEVNAVRNTFHYRIDE